MSKVNAHKKMTAANQEIFLDKVTGRTATVAGATTGLILATDEIVEVTGVTGNANYLALLPNPSTLPAGKRFLIVGKAFASKLGVVNTPTACTVNLIAGATGTGTIAVGGCYEVIRTSATSYLVKGMVIA